MNPFDQAWALLKEWKDVAVRIEQGRKHLQEPPKLWPADPPRVPRKGGLYPSISGDWQPAALSMILGMVQPDAVRNTYNLYPHADSPHAERGKFTPQLHYRMSPYDEGKFYDEDEFSESIPPKEQNPS